MRFLATRPSSFMSLKIACASDVRFTTDKPPTVPVVPGATMFSTRLGLIVDHLLEAVKPGEGPVVDLDAGERLHRLHHELRTAHRHRRVDLVRSVPGYRHVRVAWEAEDRRLVQDGVDGHQVDRVGALARDD